MHRGKYIALGLGVGLLGWLLTVTPWGAGLEEDAGLSWLFHLRGARQAPSDVVVVAIDKRSAEGLGLPLEPHQWPREKHARLVSLLANAGASTIAFDFFFARSTEHDIEFAEAIREAGNVVLVGFLKRDILSGKGVIDRLVYPTSLLEDSAFAVAAFPLPKVPARVNTFWTFMEGPGQGSPSLPVLAFQTHALPAYDDLLPILKKIAGDKANNLPASHGEIVGARNVTELASKLRAILASDVQAPARVLREIQESELDLEKKRILASLVSLYQGSPLQYLNFYGPPRTIKTLAYDEVVSLSSAAAAEFKGKAVFVGFSEALQPDQKDNYYTVFSQPTGLDLSGVEIAATAFANLLEDMPLRPLGDLSNFGVIVLWGVLLGVICQFFSISVAAMLTVLLMLAYLVAAVHQFAAAGIWLPVVVPLCFQGPAVFGLTALFRYQSANRERQNIRKAFGYYLPDRVVAELASKTESAASENQLVYGTCLATDAERYTAVAESMDPRQLSLLMNDYYRTIFRPVEQHGGIVSDVEGDAMLALWAASSPDAGLRSRACHAALDIARAVSEFNQKRPRLRTRIGLDSGVMALGTIGAGHHYEYRAVGDIVNTAHRIQSLNKRLGTWVLVSETALDGTDSDFLVRNLGSFVLQGKTRATRIFELLCRREDASSEQLSLCAAFEEALEAYQAERWAVALNKFSEILRMFPGDGPTRFYFGLCEQHTRDSAVAYIDSGVVRIA